MTYAQKYTIRCSTVLTSTTTTSSSTRYQQIDEEIPFPRTTAARAFGSILT